MMFDSHQFRKTLVLLWFLIPVANYSIAQDSGGEGLIHLNQIGFYPEAPKNPEAPKKAVIEKDISGSFFIISTKTGERVFSGTLSEPRTSQYGKKVVRIADFSSFSQPGEYELKVPSVGRSYPFKISQNIFQEVADAALKGFYFQRASAALPKEYAGKWHRKAGHWDDSVLVHSSAATSKRPEGTVINSAKGWYDAGDYNKYIVNSGITMATLMSLYEDFPIYSKKIDINFPEANNEIPDLLDEILWNLRWMLTMQDPNDGGVYHKMTSPGFSGMVMPHEDDDARYVIQKSTAATLDFAAVMAQASRIFDDYDQELPGLADSCLSAGKKAWQWVEKNPYELYSQRRLNERFSPQIVTGAYGDRSVKDEFNWAAIELFVTTGNSSYYQTVKNIKDEISIPSWPQVQTLGYYTLLRFKDKLNSIPEKDIYRVKKYILKFADQLVNGANKTAYQTVMGYDRNNYIWGSNSVAANQSILLIQAYELSSDPKYKDAALSNVDYLLGRNATGYSFITGYGENPPMHPHHRPSEADGVQEPVPGLLVGGPNPGQQDECQYLSSVPDESYSDTVCSYASNEIAINWNAPLVYILHAVQAVHGR